MQDHLLDQARQTYPQLPLRFAEPVLVVGGAPVDLGLLKDLAQRFPVIAADGGANQCLAAGVRPRAILGDMDSLEDSAQFGTATEIFPIGEQETIDFEKCVYAIQSPLIIVMGMSGGRLDHTLAALNVLARFGSEQKFLLIDEQDIALSVAGSVKFVLPVGARVSVVPLMPIQFAKSEGLVYPLDGLAMDPAGRIGSSNVSDAEQVEIKVAGAHAQTPYLIHFDISHLDAILEQT